MCQRYDFITIASVMVILSFGANPSAGVSSARAEGITLKDLEELNERNKDAVRTAVIVELVSESYAARPGEDEEAGARMRAAFAAQMEAATEEALSSDAGPGRLERIDAKYRSRLASVDGSLVVKHLNKETNIERTRTIDFERRQARYDDEDLHDLERLIDTNQLDRHQAAALSKTQSIFMTDDRSVRLVPAINLALISSWGQRFDAEKQRRQFGLIPAWVFDPQFVTDLTGGRDETGAYLEITGRDSRESRRVFLVRVRPELDYRMTKLVTYDEQGDVAEEFLASDFRSIDGVPVPFETHTNRSRDGLRDWYCRQRIVQNARINVALPAEDLVVIPKGYRVQDTRVKAPVYTKE